MVHCLLEESAERVISFSGRFVSGQLTVRLDTVLQAVQLPAGITDLDSGLTNVYRNYFTLKNVNKN